MRQRLEALDEFAYIKANGDCIRLLKAIRSLTFNFQSQKFLPHSIHEARRRFYLFSQGKLPTATYYEQFLNIVEVIESIDGNIGMDPGIEEIVTTEKGRDVTAMTDADRLEAQQRYLAVALVLGSDCARYGTLI
jgi:hypothetical protein